MLKALLHVPVIYTHLQDQYLVEIAEFFSSRSYCICNIKYINKKYILESFQDYMTH